MTVGAGRTGRATATAVGDSTASSGYTARSSKVYYTRPGGSPSAQVRRATDVLGSLLDRYEATPQPIPVSFRELVGPIPVNDLTHSVHPYPGRLLRQIPRFLLHCGQLVAPGDTVLDPFCGSGTVLVEARAAGLHGWGIDVNPFARLLSSVKTTPLRVDQVTAAGMAVASNAESYRRADRPDVVNIDYWFTSSVQSALGRLHRAIVTGAYQPELERFLLLCLALAADRTSLRDPRIPVPVRRRDWESWAQKLTEGDVWLAFTQACTNVGQRVSTVPKGDLISAVSGNSASRAHELFDRSVSEHLPAPQLVLTSPPYGAAQKYIRSSELAIGWTGLARSDELADLERASIGREHLHVEEMCQLDVPSRSIRADIESIRASDPRRAAIYAHYFRDMDAAFQSVSRVLAPGGAMVVVAGGNVVAGLAVATHEHLRDLALRHGLAHILELRDEIRGRTLLTKRANSGSPLRSETVHIFRKPAA